MSERLAAQRSRKSGGTTSDDVAGCGCSVVLLAVGYFIAARFGGDPGNTERSAVALLGGLALLLGLQVGRHTWAQRRQRHRTWGEPVVHSPIGVATWRDAELLAVRHMRALGFLDARDTGPGSDGGIDAAATGAVAQVKMHNKPIGRPDLQRLYGAAAGRQQPQSLLFYSYRGFTSTAQTYADERGILLFEFDRAGTVRALNGAAVRALRSV
ncbi:restriction endonuclease [Streptomyces sp. NPDC055059]